ncbi:hypothetical protein JOE65_001930 [Arthrobacter roseus]|nr:hypothetical protein [Arthrobacter roseus]
MVSFQNRRGKSNNKKQVCHIPPGVHKYTPGGMIGLILI